MNTFCQTNTLKTGINFLFFVLRRVPPTCARIKANKKSNAGSSMQRCNGGGVLGLKLNANVNYNSSHPQQRTLTLRILAQVCEVVVGIMLGTSTQRFNAMLHTCTS